MVIVTLMQGFPPIKTEVVPPQTPKFVPVIVMISLPPGCSCRSARIAARDSANPRLQVLERRHAKHAVDVHCVRSNRSVVGQGWRRPWAVKYLLMHRPSAIVGALAILIKSWKMYSLAPGFSIGGRYHGAAGAA